MELPNRKLTCELHVHDPAACYGLICELEEHTHSADPGSTCTRVRCSREEFPDHYEWNSRAQEWQHKPGLPGSKYNWWWGWYECCTKAEHTHTETGENPCYGWTCGYPDHEHDEECYEYKYTIYYELYLDGKFVDDGEITGYGELGDEVSAPKTVTFNGRVYTLGSGQTAKLTIGAECNVLEGVKYYATTPYVPPQVVRPEPTPPPVIDQPEEEIPTTVPDEAETDIEEEEFEDEEIPTDVPETGDASPIYTALALIALAGAAFALTFKKSRNNG